MNSHGFSIHVSYHCLIYLTSGKAGLWTNCRPTLSFVREGYMYSQTP